MLLKRILYNRILIKYTYNQQKYSKVPFYATKFQSAKVFSFLFAYISVVIFGAFLDPKKCSIPFWGEKISDFGLPKKTVENNLKLG